jgi:SsrA-binding protein
MNTQESYISSNKKAYFDYEIQDKLEAGLILTGPEVKSVRDGRVNLKGSYVAVLSDGPYVMDMHISEYAQAGLKHYEPKSKRKLLLNKKEIEKLLQIEKTGGLAVVPTKIYFKKGLIKLEIAVGKGKKMHDKRNSIKKSAQKIEIQRALKHY